MSDRLVQTRVPPERFAQIAALAAQEGESVAGWLRRLLFRELRKAPPEVSLGAWFLTDALSQPRYGEPSCRLVPVGTASATERLFVLRATAQRPLPTIPIRAHVVVVIEGSSSHWEIVSHFEVAGATQIGLRSRGTFLEQPQPARGG